MTKDKDIDDFIAGWTADGSGLKPAFVEYRDFLAGLPGVSLDFRARPGISYSLRASHSAQKKRNLFALVDVVDDEPDNRWLSVCFYADMVDDPDDLGDFVPAGLMGEDAACFNLDENDSAMRAYILERLRQAAAKAGA